MNLDASDIEFVCFCSPRFDTVSFGTFSIDVRDLTAYFVKLSSPF